MVEKREKQKRDLTKAQETVFWKELEIVDDRSGKMTPEDVRWARSCCTNNFTEYEVLQNLNFNYPGFKRSRGRPRRHVKAQETKCFGERDPNNSTTGMESRLQEKLVQGEESSENVISSKSDEGKTVSSRIPAEPETIESVTTATCNVSDEGASGKTCCGNIPTSTKRLQDMSSDSDFEDEPKRRVNRGHFIRRRLVKSRRMSQQKNGVIPCNETTSVTNERPSSQLTTQLNGLDIYQNQDLARDVEI